MKKIISSEKRLKASRLNSIKGGKVVQDRRIDEYTKAPRVCLQCGVNLPYEKRLNKFCNASHAASYNNTGKSRRRKSLPNCVNCGKVCPTPDRKYCCISCSANFRRKYSPDEVLSVRRNQVRECSANYRAKVRSQTPVEVDRKAIKEFYANCPEGYEVDHIIPISKGGLHTLENLQYLTISENRKKSNKLVGGAGLAPALPEL